MITMNHLKGKDRCDCESVGAKNLIRSYVGILKLHILTEYSLETHACCYKGIINWKRWRVALWYCQICMP